MTEDTTTLYMDFDRADREVESRPVEFKLAGERWEADLNLNAGRLLRWMRQGSRIEAVPTLLEALLGDDQYERFEDKLDEERIPFSDLEDLLVWLVKQVGGSGN